jgi:hypothetical protein
MYWMLLPLDANPTRHLSTDAGTQNGAWAQWFRAAWSTIADLVRGTRR